MRKIINAIIREFFLFIPLFMLLIAFSDYGQYQMMSIAFYCILFAPAIWLFAFISDEGYRYRREYILEKAGKKNIIMSFYAFFPLLALLVIWLFEKSKPDGYKEKES